MGFIILGMLNISDYWRMDWNTVVKLHPPTPWSSNLRPKTLLKIRACRPCLENLTVDSLYLTRAEASRPAKVTAAVKCCTGSNFEV